MAGDPQKFVHLPRRLTQGLHLSISEPAFSNIPVNLQNGLGAPLLIAYKNLAALHNHLSPITASMGEFTFPVPLMYKDVINNLTRLGKTSVQQRVSDLAKNLVSCPAIERFRSLVPGNNATRRITHDNGVMSQLN